MIKSIYKYVVAAAITVIATCSASAVSPQIGESINYRVMYKWGLVNKQAGTVNLSVHPGPSSGEFTGLLTAKSAPWADKLYKVRDTLRGNISRATLEPSIYEKISHEGSDHRHDVVKYSRNGSAVKAHCTRTKLDGKGNVKETTEIDLEASGLTIDMLSAFYYMRSINYNKMKPGESITINVFSGKRKELLTITYDGPETIELDDKQVNTIHIRFKFTGKGGKKTSDDMDAWLSTDAAHIPLKMVGKLPVGQIQCYYMP